MLIFVVPGVCLISARETAADPPFRIARAAALGPKAATPAIVREGIGRAIQK